MNSSFLYIGLMSGTSLDGVDAVLLDMQNPTQPRAIAQHHRPYTNELREALLTLNTPSDNELHRAACLSVQLIDLYAKVITELLANNKLTAAQISAVGCHGQTIRHRPELAYTLQLNAPAHLAERTQITVVADFRNRDIAAGGQGAPLVPAFHDQVLRDQHVHRVVLNLGGIANLTDLHPTRATSGFDTGPANILMDAWIAHIKGERFDQDGAWARNGRVIDTLLARMLAHPYFAQPIPKSCGREEFSLAWVQNNLSGQEHVEDVQATLLELSARSISDACLKTYGSPAELLVCGGGARNLALLERIQTLLPDTTLKLTDNEGIRAEWVEAAAFAWLAYRCMHGLSGNLPTVTGARGERILGAIYPA